MNFASKCWSVAQASLRIGTLMNWCFRSLTMLLQNKLHYCGFVGTKLIRDQPVLAAVPELIQSNCYLHFQCRLLGLITYVIRWQSLTKALSTVCLHSLSTTLSHQSFPRMRILQARVLSFTSRRTYMFRMKSDNLLKPCKSGVFDYCISAIRACKHVSINICLITPSYGIFIVIVENFLNKLCVFCQYLNLCIFNFYIISLFLCKQ